MSAVFEASSFQSVSLFEKQCFVTTREIAGLLWPIQVIGREYLKAIPPDCGVMVVADHESYLDPWIIANVYKQQIIRFLAKKELCDISVQRRDWEKILSKKAQLPVWLVSVLSRSLAHGTKALVGNSVTILVDRENARSQLNVLAKATVLDELLNGGAVCVFPQRGIGWPDDKATSSPIKWARSTGSVIVPIHIGKRVSGRRHVVTIRPVITDLSGLRGPDLMKIIRTGTID